MIHKNGSHFEKTKNKPNNSENQTRNLRANNGIEIHTTPVPRVGNTLIVDTKYSRGRPTGWYRDTANAEDRPRNIRTSTQAVTPVTLHRHRPYSRRNRHTLHGAVLSRCGNLAVVSRIDNVHWLNPNFGSDISLFLIVTVPVLELSTFPYYNNIKQYILFQKMNRICRYRNYNEEKNRRTVSFECYTDFIEKLGFFLPDCQVWKCNTLVRKRGRNTASFEHRCSIKDVSGKRRR